MRRDLLELLRDSGLFLLFMGWCASVVWFIEACFGPMTFVDWIRRVELLRPWIAGNGVVWEVLLYQGLMLWATSAAVLMVAPVVIWFYLKRRESRPTANGTQSNSQAAEVK